MILKLTTLIVCSFLHITNGYPEFQQKIPNGEIVPSSCNPNYVWQGVGHQAKGGGGPRNPFGLAFKANGFTWTTALCNADSDGDGKTNGQELGDPDCTWSQGAKPKTSLGLSHPGICEPIDSEQCRGKNDFLDCSSTEFVCEALSDPDVIKQEVRVTNSTVPAKETTYICQVHDLPTDKDYHLVAAEPYIDNINVVHHIIVYGCPDQANITADKYQPHECFMGTSQICQDIIALWSVGGNGVCYHPNAGFRIGKTGYKRVFVTMHWNNPMRIATYTDSSGLTLYYTPNLKPNDAGIIIIGQSHLVIPPGRDNFTVNGSCSSQCTQQRRTGDIYFVGAFNHMHYLGSSALSQIITKDKRVVELGRDDTATILRYDEPIMMEAGSELQMVCKFKSTSRSSTTFGGESTSEEMCYAFLMYYPKQNWNDPRCIQNGPADICAWRSGVVNGCNIRTLWNISDPNSPARFSKVWANCQVGLCLEECKPIASEVLSHPCFQYPLDYFWQTGQWLPPNLGIQDKMKAFEYWSKLTSCKSELALQNCDKSTNWNPSEWPVAATNGLVTSLMTSLAFAVVAALIMTVLI